MANTTDDQTGWQQIRAGGELITWTKLALWNELELRFVAADEDKFEFESKGWRQVHPEYGRLICWATFGVGSEYLAKGFCLVRNPSLVTDKPALKIPSQVDTTWIGRIISKRQTNNLPSFKQANPDLFEETPQFVGNLNAAISPLYTNLSSEDGRDLVVASFELLRDSIRNRDLHLYAKDKRAFHFHAVEPLFVKAFNILLANLDQNELHRCLSKLE